MILISSILVLKGDFKAEEPYQIWQGVSRHRWSVAGGCCL